MFTVQRLEEIASLLPAVDSVEGLVATVDAIVEQVVDIEHSGFYLFNPETNRLELRSAKGFTEAERLAAEETAMQRHPGKVFRSREVILAQDVENDPKGTSSSPRGFGIQSRLYLPIMCRDRCVGTFGLASERPYAFTDEHITLLSFVCSIAGVVYTQLQTAARQRALEEQLFHSQKMEALGRLAGGVAHDFNNFLTVISGYTGLLSESITNPEVLEDLATIQEATDGAANLSRRLLAFSRRDAVVPECINIRKELLRRQAFIQPLLGSTISLNLVFSEEEPQIEVDPGEFELVLMNLAVNARDAMPEGGTLTFTVRCESLRASTDGVSPAGKFVRIEIADTGVGMDETTKSRIFEPFYTTKVRGRGTGLGLATIRAIVRRYSGRISVDSTLGSGTCFTIDFPRSQGQVESNVLDDAPVHDPRSGTETILLAEDEPMISSLVTRTLETAGYTVLTASDGVEALTCLRNQPEPVHLVITDMLMPNMTGLELIKEMRKEFPDTTVMVITGYTSDLRLGADLTELQSLLLRKPFTPSLLLQRVRGTLDAVERNRLKAQ